MTEKTQENKVKCIGDGDRFLAPGTTEARNLVERFGDIINVKDFGAKGDGQTDDTEALQRALDHGGVVHFPPGRYLFSQTLRIRDSLVIDGYGAVLIWIPDALYTRRPFLTAQGGLEDEITLASLPEVVDGNGGYSQIETTVPHNFAIGDRIIIQSLRDVCADESQLWLLGSPSEPSATSWFAEVLTINEVISDTVFRSTKQLIYPYYYPNKTSIDLSPYARDHSTVRRANFIKVVINGLEVHCYDEAYGVPYSNAGVLQLCERPTLNDVSVFLYKGHGCGLSLSNCWGGSFINCTLDNSRVYSSGPADSRFYDNHFLLRGCWDTRFVSCRSVHGGQPFDVIRGTDIGVYFESPFHYVPCPNIHASVEGCTISEASDDSANNHSQCYKHRFKGCTFIGNTGFAQVRSPYTTFEDCTFEMSVSTDTAKVRQAHILFTGITFRGSTVRGCSFRGGWAAIRIQFDTPLGAPAEYDPSLNISAKNMNLLIAENEFSDLRQFIYIEDIPAAYLFDAGGEFLPSATHLHNIFILNNRGTQLEGIAGVTLIRVGQHVNGVIIDGLTAKMANTSNYVVAFSGNTQMHSQVSNCLVEFPSSTGYLGSIPARLPDTISTVDGNTYDYSKWDADFNTYNQQYNNHLIRGQRLNSIAPYGELKNAHSIPIATGSNYNSSAFETLGRTSAYKIYKVGESGSTSGVLFDRGMGVAPLGLSADLSNRRLRVVLDGQNLFAFEKTNFRPQNDAAIDLGSASYRWNNVRAATGSIVTSDRNRKRDISDIPVALLEAWSNIRPKLFRFIDGQRLHAGYVAQDFEEIFLKEIGVDPREYGFFCYDEWPAREAVFETVSELVKEAEYDEEGKLVSPEVFQEVRVEVEPARAAGSLYGIRYEEALVLEAAYQRWRYEQLESRVAALEAALAGGLMGEGK